jgi:hypothetical protein
VVHICNSNSQEEETGRYEFKASLGSIARPYLTKRKKKDKISNKPLILPILYWASSTIHRKIKSSTAIKDIRPIIEIKFESYRWGNSRAREEE